MNNKGADQTACLCGCAGWSLPLLFTYGKNRFSYDMTQLILVLKYKIHEPAACLLLSHMGHVMWKPVYTICEQQRCRSACASTVWSAPLFSLLRQCNTYTCYLQNSRTVASLCNWVGWFESYLVANPKTGFLVKRLILNSLVMIAVDCRVAVPTFPPPHTPLLHIPSPWKVLNGLGAKLRYKGYFASLLQPPGWKIWLLSWVRHMSWGLVNPCFTKLPVVIFL